MQKRLKFLAAENLNRLAKWLRILGYDTLILKNVSFAKVRNIAQKERRIYLTRSSKEAKSPHRFSRLLLKTDNLHKQLCELSSILEYDQEKAFTRCPICNRQLQNIEPCKIKSRIPRYVFENFQEFRYCRKCGRIFWQGSHYHKMENMLKEIIDKDKQYPIK